MRGSSDGCGRWAGGGPGDRRRGLPGRGRSAAAADCGRRGRSPGLRGGRQASGGMEWGGPEASTLGAGADGVGSYARLRCSAAGVRSVSSTWIRCARALWAVSGRRPAPKPHASRETRQGKRMIIIRGLPYNGAPRPDILSPLRQLLSLPIPCHVHWPRSCCRSRARTAAICRKSCFLGRHCVPATACVLFDCAAAWTRLGVRV